MYCPNCGEFNTDEQKICKGCSYDLSKEMNKEEKDVTEEFRLEELVKEEKDDDNKNTNIEEDDTKINIPLPDGVDKENIEKIIYSVLAGAVFLMLFFAAHKVSVGGNGIMEIQSVGGRTLDEAYYYELGSIYQGYAMLLRALGIFFAAKLVHMGFKK